MRGGDDADAEEDACVRPRAARSEFNLEIRVCSIGMEYPGRASAVFPSYDWMGEATETGMWRTGKRNCGAVNEGLRGNTPSFRGKAIDIINGHTEEGQPARSAE